MSEEHGMLQCIRKVLQLYDLDHESKEQQHIIAEAVYSMSKWPATLDTVVIDHELLFRAHGGIYP